MSTNQTTIERTTRLASWLSKSLEIMSGIEIESEPTTHQLHQVGAEWAGTLSRLR